MGGAIGVHALWDYQERKTDEDVIIVTLTKEEWNESSNAMKILCKFAQKEKEKEKKKVSATVKIENSTGIVKSIETLFNNIFLKKQAKENNEQNVKQVKVDIYTKMKDLTSDEFDNILNQVTNNDDNDDVNENNQDTQQLKNEFCENYDGFPGFFYYYRIESLPSLSIDIYQLMYGDFLSINNQLIDFKLKNFLLKHSINGEDDVDFIYSKFIRRRNICALLPFKHCEKDWNIHGLDYIELINRFNKNKNKKLKLFCIIYNCISSVFITGDNSKYGGFDKYIHYFDYNQPSNESNDIKPNLSSLCQWYILIEMIKTGIFGNDNRLTSPEDHYYGKDVYDSSVVSFIVANVFDNDLSSFKQLTEYCVQDIKENNDIDHLKNIYGLNDNYGRGYYGISFYILNRLSYVIFHDLLCIDMKKNDDNLNDLLLFPSLIKFYKFLYNFAIYCHCYPHFGAEGKKVYELFYMKEYYKFKNTMYDYKMKKNLSTELHRFNYYCYNEWDGSLIHCAVYNNFVGYVELLLKNGFDPYMTSRYSRAAGGNTPVSLAKEKHLVIVLSLFEDVNIKYSKETKQNEKYEGKENETGKEKEKEKENGLNVMNMQSLSLRYDSFSNSLMAGIYFLKCLGFDDINQENERQLNIRHELVTHRNELYGNCYWDDFVCNISSLDGLKIGSNDNNVNINVNKNSNNDVMTLLLQNVVSLIELKMPLSIDLLILSCIYANYCTNFNFFDTLESTIMECLNGSDDNYKTRNYQWFKHYILNSNIWLVKIPTKRLRKDIESEKHIDKKIDKTENTILFDIIVVRVNKLLTKQKKYIWNNIKQIRNEKKSNSMFEKLCTFGNDDERKISDGDIQLRQDRIENGIVSNVNEFDLSLQKVVMGVGEHSNFDLTFENNTKSYLTQCLAFAHANNNTLQSEMQEYFNDKLKIVCQYSSAPVKLATRCIVKATSDYGRKEYPSCANIVDFLRFSVTFDNVNDLLNGLNQFVSDVDKGDVISCLVPNGILRIKNGFNDILTKWESMHDASYVDIKLNLVYVNKNTNQKMIVEAQFLLSFLLKAKKMGHKYYRYSARHVFYILVFCLCNAGSAQTSCFLCFLRILVWYEKHDLL